MVKADAKHDYYADLQVPPDADQETIKKQFRFLAKQYHPDRNPGKETEVVAKFQAVQAAHEILSDTQQKSKYDTDRAKYLRKTEPEPFTLKRSQTTREPAFNNGFKQPPPPRTRNGSVDTSTRAHQASASAEKFAQFTRAAQWERAKYEEATAGAEALRNFHSMRNQQPPMQPPRPARPPTAPKSNSAATSPEYKYANGLNPGFPGMSRTQSAPRRQGFSPASPGSDEPPAKSAYAYVHNNRDKPWQHSNTPPPPPTSSSNPTSPPLYRARPAESPLRPSRSSNFEDPQRPPLARASSRYATNGGEKTSINRNGLGRSASVRTSPVDKNLGDRGPFGTRARSSMDLNTPSNHAQHRSVSPGMKPPTDAQFQFSATETSSSEDESEKPNARPKAVPRSYMRPPPTERSTSNDPALTGQYTNKNYTRLVDENQYNYPPPEGENVPFRRPFDPGPPSVNDVTDEMNATGLDDRNYQFPKPIHSNPDANGSADGGHHRHNHTSFSAHEWDGKFTNGDNIFIPSEKDRKSPTKSSRSRSAAKTKASVTDANEDSEDISPTMPNSKAYANATSPQKDGAFKRATFSADDWAKRFKSQDTGNERPKSTQSGYDTQTAPEPMDIDPDPTAPSRPIPTIRVNSGSRKNSHGGVDLSDLADTAPFKPSAEGLDSISADLASSLPYKSRAADQVQLTGPSGAALRGMSLPKPPKPVLAPEHITQESWELYCKKMQQYMKDWNEFNNRMIDHFRIRQNQINHSMYQNWVMGEGEGANAQDVDGSDLTSPPPSAGTGSSKPMKAGYHTYMQWLEQDELCRHWWDISFDEHRKCLVDLGRMRRQVKAIRDRQDGTTPT